MPKQLLPSTPPPSQPQAREWTFSYFLFFVGWLLLLADLPFLVIWLGPVVKGTASVESLLLSGLTLAPLVAVSALVLIIYSWRWADAVERRQMRYTVLISVALLLAFSLPSLVRWILHLIGPGLEEYASEVTLATYVIGWIFIGLYLVLRVFKSFDDASR